MENMNKTYPSVLSIAGSDSGGGAGIQADIKSISACGAYAASVITATTAQNTMGVIDIHEIPLTHIQKQIQAVLEDISFGAIKVGMLHSCEVIKLVQSQLRQYKQRNIIIDPVMVATSGDKLIHDEAIACLNQFLPDALLITPNAKEAEILVGEMIDHHNAAAMAKKIGDRYKTSILLKGGHLNSQDQMIKDYLFLYDTKDIVTIKNQKIETQNTHGTGCSLSSSIAAFISLGKDLKSAVIKGCTYVHHAIDQGKNIHLGHGNGPINHFNIQED
ncbi:bifunctional hydroxymethylpyrimidine kinase/phosphomethylpyrimidine kinase [Flavobacteriaceae bacterium Ap0902]|nr:bifunctional hydroxymethylpyrimidine kinase/phosphomethylpyrimidine kinase [Flavobacteriaceae bacterium Ap0902]